MTIIEQKEYQGILKRFICENQMLHRLEGKTILLTGATGMIGSFLVDVVMTYNQKLEEEERSIRLIAMGRNKERARQRFNYCWGNADFLFVEHDVKNSISNVLDVPVTYIIHAGSNADPVSFAKYPADTLLANVLGTRNLLDYGLKHEMIRFLYVSSGEMYGQPDKNMSDFVETYCGAVDYASPRACYPAGKRAAEVLCQSYITQYSIDAVIARPCHIFGPTMNVTDSRAVSEFLRNAAVGKDIVLKSAGLVERSHCYVADAAAALLYILCEGVKGQAYNIADKKYQMTIREFAEWVAESAGVQCCFAVPSDAETKGYSVVNRAVLSAERLTSIGWQPAYNIEQGIKGTIDILRDIMETT